MDRLMTEELRQIAMHVVPLLPRNDSDFEQVIKFVRELRQWEKQSDPDDDGEGELSEDSVGTISRREAA